MIRKAEAILIQARPSKCRLSATTSLILAFFWPRLIMSAALAEEGEMITGAKVQAARHLLGWSIIDLASRSAVGRRVIERFEKEEERPSDQFVAQIETALVRGGITFSADKVVLNPKASNDE
jgi:hypothetical protein